jgi:hypothetical protein
LLLQALAIPLEVEDDDDDEGEDKEEEEEEGGKESGSNRCRGTKAKRQSLAKRAKQGASLASTRRL